MGLTVVLVSCKDDEPGPDPGNEVSLDDLVTLITEANGLLDGAEEGFELGQYQIGSIAKLQDVVDNAQQIVDAQSEDQALIDNAESQLKTAIDDFKASVIATVANPWVQQAVGNKIKLVDNVSGGGTEGALLGLIDVGKSFTIELDIYPVSFETIFNDNGVIGASAQFDGSGQTVDDGFYVRYHDNGHLFYEVGSPGGGWQGTGTADGGLVVGQWNHIAYMHDGEEQILYVNGNEVFRTQFNYQSITENANENIGGGINIGGAIDWGDRTSNALYKDIRIWSKAIPAADLNKDGLTGTGDGLEAWFPMASDQGNSFADVSGNFRAELDDLVVWAPNGDPDQVEVDYTALEALISDAESFAAGITEGTNAGDYGIGTGEWLQQYIDEADEVVSSSGSGADVANAIADLEAALDIAKENKVAGGAANGFSNDGENGAMRVTPNWHPEGASFTIDFMYRPTQLGGDITGNGELGVFFDSSNDPEGEGPSGLQYYYSDTDLGDWSRAITDAGVMSVDTWYNIVLAYDADNKTQTVYVDGAAVATKENVGPAGNNGWGELWIGASWGYCKGSFQSYRVWNKVLTADQFQADIADASNESDLEVYLPFDIKDAPIFKDATGNHFVEQRGEITWIE